MSTDHELEKESEMDQLLEALKYLCRWCSVSFHWM